MTPWDGERLLDGQDERLDLYPGLAAWWRDAERVWAANRSSERLTLRERLDYRRGLSQQFPAPPHRVVYSASGMYLAAARVNDPHAIVEHKLYWAAAASLDEARYLTAVLNSSVLTELVRPLQARGEHNPRDFDKYVFRVGIPLFDPDDAVHTHLSVLAAEAETVAAAVDLPEGRRFEMWRRLVRKALTGSSAGMGIEEVVAELLTPTAEALGIDPLQKVLQATNGQ